MTLRRRSFDEAAVSIFGKRIIIISQVIGRSRPPQFFANIYGEQTKVQVITAIDGRRRGNSVAKGIVFFYINRVGEIVAHNSASLGACLTSIPKNGKHLSKQLWE